MKKIIIISLSVLFITPVFGKLPPATMAQPETDNSPPLERLGNQKYKDVLGTLQAIYGRDSAEVTALNRAYKSLKEKGVNEPTLLQVIQEDKKNTVTETANAADAILLCQLAMGFSGASLVTSLGTLTYSYIAQSRIDKMQGAIDKAKCGQKASQLLDDVEKKNGTPAEEVLDNPAAG